MKKNLLLASFLCSLLLCTGCSLSKIDSEPPLTFIVASDPHYFSPSLTDGNDLYLSMIANGDGKLTHYSDQITDAFLEEVREAAPAALILSGDLTYNGELQSHIDLAAKLTALQEDGIPVLVIPGNHDIGSMYACRFEGEYAHRVDGLTEQEFRSLYGELGYNNALSRDTNTFSYVTALSDQFRVIMLDVNTEASYLSVADATYQWLEDQLKDAQESGASVITVTHQNLLMHSRLFSTGYIIKDSEKLQSLFARYQMQLNLSGHMHIQHIASYSSAFFEIAGSSLAVAPNQYGVITVDKKQNLTYHTEPVDAAAWARDKNMNDPNLLDFAAYTDTFFRSSSLKKIQSSIQVQTLTDHEQKAMEDFAVEVNTRYFAGTVWQKAKTLLSDEAYSLWKKQSDTVFFSDYLNSMLEGYIKDENMLYLPKNN